MKRDDRGEMRRASRVQRMRPYKASHYAPLSVPGALIWASVYRGTYRKADAVARQQSRAREAAEGGKP